MSNEATSATKGPGENRVVYVPAYSGGMPGVAADDEIDLLELWNILWRGRYFIVGFTLACTLVAVFWTLFILPVIFKSEAVLLPTEQPGGSRLAGLSGLAGMLPLDLGGGGKSVNIVNFLQSRDLQQRLIEKYNLLAHFNPEIWDGENRRWLVDESEQPSLVKALQTGLVRNILNVSQSRDTGLITISWQDQDPAFAATMLERVIAELNHFLDHEYETDAKREREFIERQVASATKELEFWEQQVPSQDLTMAKIQRERAASQTVYSELRKQLELAKITEAKEVARFKVLDSPFIPEIRSSPKRTLICAVTIVASGMLAVFLVFGWHALLNLRNRQATTGAPASSDSTGY